MLIGNSWVILSDIFIYIYVEGIKSCCMHATPINFFVDFQQFSFQSSNCWKDKSHHPHCLYTLPFSSYIYTHICMCIYMQTCTYKYRETNLTWFYRLASDRMNFSPLTTLTFFRFVFKLHNSLLEIKINIKYNLWWLEKKKK